MVDFTLRTHPFAHRLQHDFITIAYSHFMVACFLVSTAFRLQQIRPSLAKDYDYCLTFQLDTLRPLLFSKQSREASVFTSPWDAVGEIGRRRSWGLLIRNGNTSIFATSRVKDAAPSSLISTSGSCFSSPSPSMSLTALLPSISLFLIAGPPRSTLPFPSTSRNGSSPSVLFFPLST